MPDDKFRYELDDGVLIVSPAPSTNEEYRTAAPFAVTIVPSALVTVG
jgi:hypothetical protein